MVSVSVLTLTSGLSGRMHAALSRRTVTGRCFADISA
jgi:hypothetical protein